LLEYPSIQFVEANGAKIPAIGFGSLVKLRLAEIDLLRLHGPNPQVPLQETLGALAHVKKLGMARHIGVSNFTVALIEQAVAACPKGRLTDFGFAPDWD
jgi:aryl-alcohol dehydrogenase-like predicted oxidoreductase